MLPRTRWRTPSPRNPQVSPGLRQAFSAASLDVCLGRGFGPLAEAHQHALIAKIPPAALDGHTFIGDNHRSDRRLKHNQVPINSWAAFGPPYFVGGNVKNNNAQRRKPVPHRKRGAWPSRNPAPLPRQPKPARGQLYFRLSEADEKGGEPTKE